jgi:predicted flap endonuclease-1-like 5' DNA nuclease
MQATSPTYRPPVGTGWLTTTSLVLIAIFAAITVIAILYGMRLRARRRAARKIEERRVEAEADRTPPPVAAPEKRVAAPAEPESAPAPTPPPVAPAPPPLDDWAAPGTPAADPLPEAPDIADEPIAAAAPFEASPAVEAESAPGAPPAANHGDRPLTTLKGLGPKVAARLEELGIATVGDLAALDEAQAAGVDARLGPFTGRMARDRWLEQARLLTAGDDKAFEAAFGKL